MSWIHVLTNGNKEFEEVNTIKEIDDEIEIKMTPDEIFDEKYGDELFDILWELKEFNKDSDCIIKFTDYSTMISELYETIKELSSGYYETYDEEEETSESEDEEF